MARVLHSRKIVGLSLVVLLLGLGIGQALLDRTAAQAPQAPQFEVDPFWPKPMPNNWLLGMTIGIGIDERDHVWIIHRGNDPGNLDRTELAFVAPNTPRVGECCISAPPVLEFDPEGNLVGSWGGPQAGAPYAWPESNHGIVVDHKGFVWIGGNGGPDAHILNYTVFGREVNVASRLEGVSGRGRIIISEATHQHLVRDDPALAGRCARLAPVTVKGIRDEVHIYEVPWREAAVEGTAQG